ncbi:MAG: relaxase domain-containing protein [Acidimicrobiia bacterium]
MIPKPYGASQPSDLIDTRICNELLDVYSRRSVGRLVLSLANAAKDYYLRKLREISPREDYYLRGGTATGQWRGNGAAELGLEGVVSVEGLVRLFDGQHPGTGEQLGRSLRRDGVAAWDVTFSADKSVSLLWALGDDETRREVVAAFEEATASALGYLESVASATRGATKTPVLDDNGDQVVNENGDPRFRVETWPIPTSGYVAASFTEFTSRADDPQLHTHVVVANKVKGIDGVWRTIDGRLLYRYQLAAGYLHEAVLRHELTERLGVRWQPVRNGMADIEGFTRPQIEAFSR